MRNPTKQRRHHLEQPPSLPQSTAIHIPPTMVAACCCFSRERRAEVGGRSSKVRGCAWQSPPPLLLCVRAQTSTLQPPAFPSSSSSRRTTMKTNVADVLPYLLLPLNRTTTTLVPLLLYRCGRRRRSEGREGRGERARLGRRAASILWSG